MISQPRTICDPLSNFTSHGGSRPPPQKKYRRKMKAQAPERNFNRFRFNFSPASPTSNLIKSSQENSYLPISFFSQEVIFPVSL